MLFEAMGSKLLSVLSILKPCLFISSACSAIHRLFPLHYRYLYGWSTKDLLFSINASLHLHLVDIMESKDFLYKQWYDTLVLINK